MDEAPRSRSLEELADRVDRLTDTVARLEAQVQQLVDARAPEHQHLRHPIRSAEHEVEHLHDVAEEGESGATTATRPSQCSTS